MFSPKLSKLGLVAVLILSRNVLAQSSKESAMAQHTSYHSVKVDGLDGVLSPEVAWPAGTCCTTRMESAFMGTIASH
jgi:hypothetical protein